MQTKSPLTLKVERIAFILFPDFSSIPLTAMTNVLRLANREIGLAIYEWNLVSPEGGVVRSSDGLGFDTRALNDVSDFETVFLFAAYRPLDSVNKLVREWIRRQKRDGRYLVGIESGAFILADARVLGDHAPALHHEDVAAFRETWPEQPISNHLVNVGQRIATVAGVYATLDLALAYLGRRRGLRVADQVARILYYRPWVSRAHLVRHDGLDENFARPVLQRCRSLMVSNIQEPLAVSEICSRLEIDERQLRRLFKNAIDVSPLQYYKAIRLAEARFILINSDMSVTDVGLACGFTNAAAFARAFKAHFGFSPSKHRQPYMGLLPSPFWPDLFKEPPRQ